MKLPESHLGNQLVAYISIPRRTGQNWAVPIDSDLQGGLESLERLVNLVPGVADNSHPFDSYDQQADSPHLTGYAEDPVLNFSQSRVLREGGDFPRKLIIGKAVDSST